MLRTPKAFSARSFILSGLRSPVAVTLTIDFAISSVSGVFPVSKSQISQRAFVSGGHRFNFIGAESTNSDQSMYGHGFIRLVVFDDDRFLMLAS